MGANEYFPMNKIQDSKCIFIETYNYKRHIQKYMILQLYSDQELYRLAPLIMVSGGWYTTHFVRVNIKR